MAKGGIAGRSLGELFRLGSFFPGELWHDFFGEESEAFEHLLLRDSLAGVDEEDHAVDADFFPPLEGLDTRLRVADRSAFADGPDDVAGAVTERGGAGVGVVGGRGVDAADPYEVSRAEPELECSHSADGLCARVIFVAVHEGDTIDLLVDGLADRLAGTDGTAVILDHLLVIEGSAKRDAEHAHAALAGLDGGLGRLDGDPERRVGLLEGFWDDVTLRHREVAATPGEVVGSPHFDDGAGAFVPHFFREVGLAAEPGEFGPGGGAACSELEATVAKDIEGGGTLGDARWVVDGREHESDAVPEADVLGLGCAVGEEDFWR